MRIKAYIYTNIYVYAIIHHPVYGEQCAEILKNADMGFMKPMDQS